MSFAVRRINADEGPLLRRMRLAALADAPGDATTTLARAEAHGDLTGGLKAIADQLIEIFGKLGLVSFGQVGDPFDPAIHEAVLHDESDQVDVPTCTTVMRPGYMHGERLLRPAMVGVSDPAAPPAPIDTEENTNES